MRKSRFGIPYFEHALGVVLAGLVIWVVSTTTDLWLEQAEATVLRATLMNIRSGLRTDKAARILRHLPPPEAGGNPVRFLQIAPAGYLPAAPAAGELPPAGSWYYNPHSQTLHYQPKRRAHLQLLSPPADAPLGWRLGEIRDGTKEVEIQTVTPFVWF